MLRYSLGSGKVLVTTPTVDMPLLENIPDGPFLSLQLVLQFFQPHFLQHLGLNSKVNVVDSKLQLSRVRNTALLPLAKHYCLVPSVITCSELELPCKPQVI